MPKDVLYEDMPDLDTEQCAFGQSDFVDQVGFGRCSNGSSVGALEEPVVAGRRSSAALRQCPRGHSDSAAPPLGSEASCVLCRGPEYVRDRNGGGIAPPQSPRTSTP
mmetsp:Transcript_36486/g.102881  ORF Transcript_36486/g.102881 Transcript_36486/m.102881 type:complete len:107 (-) Transcript_36486:9-329(-)